MRKKLGLILALILALQIVPTALGVSSNGEVSLDLDKDGTGYYENISSKTVYINLDGERLESDVPAFLWNGRTMIPLRLIAEKMGADVQWFGENNQAVITLDECIIQVEIGSAQALVNEKTVTLYDGVPAVRVKYEGVERIMVPLRFISEQLGAQVGWTQETYTATVSTGENNTSLSKPIAPEQKTVVLDAGHGGSQSGAVYYGAMEKDINLAVAQKVEDILSDLGYRVVMTRSSDKAISLEKRAALANAAKADIFVSMHANSAASDSTYTGVYTYYYPGSRQGAKLAQFVQSSVCNFTQAVDRGLLYENFAVLRKTSMCAVLVEMGFMSNYGELNNMLRPDYQDKLAAGIAEGIITYLNETYH